MELNRTIIEAAIAGFEAQKQRIDATIAELRSQLDGGAPPDQKRVAETGAEPRSKISVHVSVSDIPSPDGKTHFLKTSDDGPCLKWESLRQLKKLVEGAEYERSRRKREGRELWINWFTAVVAAVAAAASVLNVYLTSHKK